MRDSGWTAVPWPACYALATPERASGAMIILDVTINHDHHGPKQHSDLRRMVSQAGAVDRGGGYFARRLLLIRAVSQFPDVIGRPGAIGVGRG